MKFRKPLTDTVIIKQIPYVKNRRGVNEILGRVDGFNSSAVKNVTDALEKHVMGRCFRGDRATAIGIIRDARIDGMKMKPMPR